MSDTSTWNAGAGSISWAGNDSSYNMSNTGNGGPDSGFDGSASMLGTSNAWSENSGNGSGCTGTSSSMWSATDGAGCGYNGASLLANTSSSVWAGNGDGCGYLDTSMLSNASTSMWTAGAANSFGSSNGWDAAGFCGSSGCGMSYNGSSWGAYDGSGGGSASSKGGKRGRRFENGDNNSWGYDNSKGGRRAGGKHGRRYEDSSWGAYDGSGGGSASSKGGRRGRRFENGDNSWGYTDQIDEEVAWIAQTEELTDALAQPILQGPYYSKFLVPNHIAGALIGKEGTMVGEIEMVSGCRMQVSGPKQFFPGTSDRVCIVGGPSLDGLETAMMKIVDLVKKIYELANSKNSKMVLKFIVPKSVGSILIGPGGATIQKLTSETGCRINMSKRMEGFQERVIVMSGEEDALRKAVVEILRSIQGDAHLEENMNLVYTQEVPMGSWSGESNEPVDPECPLMSPQEAETKTKRELVEYLNRAAPRDILVRMKLLGRVKNAVKSTALPDLLDAVEEVWVSRGGHELPPRQPVEVVEQAVVPAVQPLRPGPVQADTQDASETSSEASEVSAATELEGDTAETGEVELPPLAVLAAALEKMEKTAVLPTPDESTGSSRIQEGQPEEEPQTRSSPDETSEATSRPPQLMAIGLVGAPLEQDDDDQPQVQGPKDAKEFCLNLVDSLVNCVLEHPAATADHSSEVCEELIPRSTSLQSVAKQLSDEERLLLAVADMQSGVSPCIEVPEATLAASSSSGSMQGYPSLEQGESVEEQARINRRHHKFLCQPDEGKAVPLGDQCTAPGDAQPQVDFQQLSRLLRRLYRRLF